MYACTRTCCLKQLKATVYVFSESVLCLGGKCREHAQSTKAWTNRIEWFTTLLNIVSWMVSGSCSSGAHHTGSPPRRPSIDGEKELKVQPQKFEGRIIFISMFDDIDWTRKGNQEVCVNNSSCVADDARHFFPERRWSFFGPGCEQGRYATVAYKPNGAWNCVGEKCTFRSQRVGTRSSV